MGCGKALRPADHSQSKWLAFNMPPRSVEEHGFSHALRNHRFLRFSAGVEFFGMFERTFFVTTVTYERKLIFRSPRMSELFLDNLFGYRDQRKFLLHEFVLMPDHLHMILTPDIKISLERALQLVKGGFSYRCAKELHFKEDIWQPKPKNHRIRDEADYERHRDYIHMNPVRAGLVTNAAEYPYSSAHPGFRLNALPTAAEAESLQARQAHG
jgi:putative transposase